MKVIIGCKMPSGFTMGFGSPTDPANYRAVHIRGANQGEIREGGLFVAHTAGGFGRTEVEASDWERWSTGADLQGDEVTDPRTGAVIKTAEVATAQLVKARRMLVDEWQAKGLVFVADSPDLAAAQAATYAHVQTGFEPVSQAGDKRAPGSVVKAA